MVKATSYKPKIGREFSFAIGFRDLSLALNGVPQSDLLQLSFWRSSVMPDNRLLVLRAGYHHRPDQGIGPGWSLSVHAVPRAKKAQVRAILLDDGIPRFLKPWLVSRAGLTGRGGEDVLDLLFSPTDGTIVAHPGPKRAMLEPVLMKKKRKGQA